MCARFLKADEGHVDLFRYQTGSSRGRQGSWDTCRARMAIATNQRCKNWIWLICSLLLWCLCRNMTRINHQIRLDLRLFIQSGCGVRHDDGPSRVVIGLIAGHWTEKLSHLHAP